MTSTYQSTTKRVQITNIEILQLAVIRLRDIMKQLVVLVNVRR